MADPRRRAKPRRAKAAKRAPRKAAPAAVPAPTPAPAPGAERALLALSRELAEARTEEQVTEAVAKAIRALFPGRSFAVRLVDPKTLALRTLHASGRLRSGARAGISLRRSAVERTGLAAELLGEGGVDVTEVDEPLFEGSERAVAVPLAVGGELFGVLNVEYGPGHGGERERDAPVLYGIANHAAICARNVRAVEELSYLKTYLENLVENANALVLSVNRDHQVVVWNAGLVRATGVPREQAVGQDLLALVREEDRPALRRVLERGFAREAVVAHEARLLRAGGGEARVAFNTAPVVGASGEVDDVVVIGQDLTLVRSLQAAAEHADRLAGIGLLVAGVVHELNNPLTAVNMYSDVLVEKLTHAGHDPADVEKLRAIHEAGLRIQRLARDLVAYARPGSARAEPVDLAEVVEEGLRLAKPVLKEHAGVVERNLAAASVEGSRASLVQVVVSLVTNAAQAIRDGGKVTVSLAPRDGEVALTVGDDGPGMTAELAARAFEPFFTTRDGAGVGLGLAIVQGIVTRHGGRVGLDTAPGRGTRVTVTLPVRRGRSPS